MDTCPSCSTPFPFPPGAFDTGGATGTGADSGSDADAATAGAPPRRAAGLEAGAPFGTRYRILRELGAGGMGVVYQAWDDELGVAVALKIVRHVAADPAVAREVEKRFKRELLLARQVTHKHVVRIHDLGEIDGTKYITMPYIKGEDLASVLRREGRLPVDRVLRIARQMAAGLHAAHEAGVVHRDLKPANIMIDADGNALIMDFGIAFSPAPDTGASAARVQASLAAAAASGSQTMTFLSAGAAAETRAAGTMETAGGTVANTGGGIVGTLEYMAPEQARGLAVDQRADLYGFGLIVSDMLTGLRRPQPGTTPIEQLTARITTAPQPLRARNDVVPSPLDDLVTRCLQLDPAARFQTTGELVAALDRLDAKGQLLPIPSRGLTRQAKIATVLVVAILMTGTWWIAHTPAPVTHAPVSVLIADFQNATGDAAFDGVVEQALGGAVEGASFISAFPRKDAQDLAQKNWSTRRIADQTAQLIAVREGINFVIGGSIERRGSGYRVSAQELTPSGGAAVHTFTASAAGKDDVLKAVSSLASQLRDALGDTSSSKSRQADIETFTSTSLDAVREYALAQDLASAYKDEEAIAHYKAALQLDQNFGRAYSGWAVSAYKLRRTDETKEAYKQALARLDRMSERERLRTQGAYLLQVAGSYDKAREIYQQLVDKYPTDRAGYSNLAVADFSLRDFTRARDEGKKAIELYPRNISFRNNYALFAMYAGDYASAAAEARKTLELDASNYLAWLPIAAAAVVTPGGGAAARDAYLAMAKTGASGASLSALGLADLAMYQGAFADAARIARAGIADDEKAKNGGVLPKRIVLAEALLAQGKMAEARQEAHTIRASSDLRAQVSAARVLLRAGAAADARDIADRLVGELSKDSRAYAKIIEAELALVRNQPAVAVDAITESRERKFSDVWLARLVMGTAYLRGGAPTEANTELETATKRRGEASDLFLDDLPTFRYLAELPYWRARAEESLGRVPAAKQDYQAFIAVRPAGEPLAEDARQRLAALK